MGAYLSGEHGEGGSFVLQMRVDMVMSRLLWGGGVVEEHLMAAKTSWEDMWEGVQELRQESEMERLSLGLTSVRAKLHPRFHWVATVKTLRELRATNKINSYWLYHVMHQGDGTITSQATWTLTILCTFSFFTSLIPSNDQVNYLLRCGGNWSLCCGSALSLSLSWHVCLPQL